MSTHELVYSHDVDTIEVRLVCNDEHCKWRWQCPGDCEVIWGMEQTETGYRHCAAERVSGNDLWHDMVLGSECAFVENLAADPALIPEINAVRETFEIGRFAVEPVWHGEDGAEWSRVSEPHDSGSER